MEVHDLATSRLTVFRESLLTPALRPVKARALTIAPEPQSPGREVRIPGEAREGEEAVSAPMESDDLD